MCDKFINNVQSSCLELLVLKYYEDIYMIYLGTAIIKIKTFVIEFWNNSHALYKLLHEVDVSLTIQKNI